MIVGLGLDILNTERFRRVHERHPLRLPHRLLAPEELERYRTLASTGERTHYLARAFCVKEAVAKALGTGMGAGVHWKHIVLQHRPGHRLKASLNGAAQEWCHRRGGHHLWLSFSSEQALLSAVAVLESKR